MLRLRKHFGILGAVLLVAIFGGWYALVSIEEHETAPHREAGDDMEYTITIDGHERAYAVHVPRGYDSGRAYPLLIVFHGSGGTRGGIRERIGFDAIADERGFVAVYPESLAATVRGEEVKKWDTRGRIVDDVAFVAALIDALSADFSIDAARVYTAGMSNGASFAQVAGCSLPQVRGVASVSSGMDAEVLAPFCAARAGAPLAFIGFYGTDDHFDQQEKFEASFDFFVRQNGCLPEYERAWVNGTDEEDETRIERMTPAASCATPLAYYRIHGGGHFWPGGAYDAEAEARRPGLRSSFPASETIADFFEL